MKIIVFFVLCCLCGMEALRAQDVIITRQSERIDAKIVEVSESEIKYKKQNNIDGPTFVISTGNVSSVIFSNGDVQSFSHAEPKKTDAPADVVPSSFRHRGWEFNVNPLLAINLGNGGGASFQATLGTGRLVADNFFLGFNVGGVFGSASNFTFGTTARAYFPAVSSAMNFFVELFLGAQTDFNDWGFSPVLMPGMQIPLSRSADFRFGIGYKGTFVNQVSVNALVLGTSFAFHSANRQRGASLDAHSYQEQPQKAAKPANPTLDKGIVFAGGVHSKGLGMTFSAGYKLNKRLTVSVGVSAENLLFDYDASVDVDFAVSDKPDIHLSREFPFRYNFSFFARGSYRLTDNVISPMISVDAGMKILNFEDYYHKYIAAPYYLELSDFMSFESSYYAPFIAPSIGLSWKVGSNSFLELKCGYDLALAFPPVSIDKIDTHVHTTCNETLFLSQFFVGLEFNHTIGVESVKKFFGL